MTTSDEQTTTSTDTREPAASEPAAHAPGPTTDPRPYRQGPAVVTVLVGLFGLVIAAGVLVGQLADLHLDIDWKHAAPVTAISLGLVVILVGLLGMRAQRRR